MATTNNLKLAIEIAVNGAKAAGDALASIGASMGDAGRAAQAGMRDGAKEAAAAIKGVGDAFKDGLHTGAREEFAKIGRSLAELEKQAGDARKALDLRPHAEIHGEIDKIKAAYVALRDSGVASAGEVAQAYLRAEEKIIDLKRETNGLAGAFDKVKASAATVVAAFAGNAAMVGKAFDFEAATVQIDKLANLGETGLARIRQDITDLAREIPITAEGLAKIGESAAQLNLPIEDYKAYISLVAKSASAFSIPVDAAGDAFGRMKKNFSLSLPELALVADSFNLLADTIPNVTESGLLNFTERLSAQGKAFGLTAQQVGAMGASLLSVTKQPEVAARAMESMLVKLQTADKAAPKFQEALGQIGLTGKQLAGDIEKGPQAALTDFMQRLAGLSDRQRTSVLGDLFGADFANEVNILAQGFTGYSDALGKVADKAGYAGNVNEAFAKDAATGAFQWQLAKQSMEEFARTVGDALSPLAKVLIQVFRDLAEVVSWVAREFPTLTAIVAVGGPLLVGFSAIKLAVGAVNLLLAKMIQGILGTGVAAKIASTAIKSAFAILSAFFVGWEIGTYLRNEFVEVRLFGIAMVKGLLLAFEGLKYGASRGWEGISYAASLMWETIKFAFDKSIAVIKGKFGDMVVSIGRGMANIPGLKDEAADVVAYGESLKKSAAATEDWSARMARIEADHAKRVAAMKAENSKEIGTIKTVTDGMASDEIMKEAARKAKAQAVPVGKDMAAGVAQGIEEGSPEAVAAMTALVKRLEDSARTEADTHSPSKKYARFGGDLIDGWVGGMVERMQAREGEIVALAKRTAELMTPKVPPIEVLPVAINAKDARNREIGAKYAAGASLPDLAKEYGLSEAWIKKLVERTHEADGVFVKLRATVENAFKGMEDAIVTFVKTGKLDFRSLADSIVTDLIRIQVQELMTQSIRPMLNAAGSAAMSVFGFAQGGAPGGPGSTLGAWRNQIVDRPTFFAFAQGGVMGEAGPEAIMPVSYGPNGRLGVDATGVGGGNVTVNIINNANGAQATQSTRSDGKGNQIIDVFIEQVKGAIAGDIARGNGAIPAALGRTYGLNPTPGMY